MSNDTPSGEILDVTKSAQAIYRKKYGTKIKIYTTIAIIVLLPLTIYMTYVTLEPRFLLFPLLIIVLPNIYYYGKVERQMEEAFMSQFAQENGYTYVPDEGDVETITSIYLRNLGHGRTISDVVSGIYNQQPLRLYTFSTTIGYGKGSHTISFSVFELTFLGELLDIILDSHLHPTEVLFGSPYPNKKKLNLEGNFNKYFDVYIPAGYETETLEILTPDLMQELIKKSSSYCFEFCGNKLFICGTHIITTKADLTDMYDFSGTLVTKLAPTLSRIKNDLSR